MQRVMYNTILRVTVLRYSSMLIIYQRKPRGQTGIQQIYCLQRKGDLKKLTSQLLTTLLFSLTISFIIQIIMIIPTTISALVRQRQEKKQVVLIFIEIRLIDYYFNRQEVVSIIMQVYINSFRVAQEEKLLKVGQGNDRIVIYDVYRQGKEGKQIDGIITNSIRITKNHLTFFTDKQAFNTYLINKEQCKISEIENKSSWSNSKYSLYYFNRTSEACLIQTNQSLAKTRITYFNFNITQEDIAFHQISSKQIEQGMHKKGREIFAVNNQGKIGCYQFLSGRIEILLYNREEGVKKFSIDLHDLHKEFTKTQFKVLDMWQNDNLLFLIVKPIQSSSPLSQEQFFSPILIVNIQKEGQCPVSFSSWLRQQKYKFFIERCINLEDYSVLLVKDNQSSSQMPYYVYNKELQDIVLEGSYNPSHSVNTVYKHNTIVFYQQQPNSNSVKCYEKQFYFHSSLSFKKTLELLQNAQSVKQKIKKGVIIFGGDKTGKSTLRHFLSGGKMIFNNDQERGLTEVIAQDDQMKAFEHDEERENITWMNVTEESAIIDVPDWSSRDLSFKVELSILLSRIFRIFQEFHIVVTIPDEYIEVPQKNQQFFKNLLDLVSKQEGMEQHITIILTKVNSGEESLQVFNERIELISQISQQTGSLIKKISEQNRILFFQNREFDEGQGKQMLQSILSFNFLSFVDRNILPVQQQIQQPSSQMNQILIESQYYIRILNTYFLSISYSINYNSFAYVQNVLQSHFLHHYKIPLQFNDITHKEDVALAFVAVLAKLRSILQLQKYDQSAVSQLRNVLMNLDAVLQGGDWHFKQTILCFISVMRNAFTLSLSNTIGKKIDPLADFRKILINQPDAVLGKNLKYIINYIQEFESVRSSEEIKNFSSLFSKSRPKIKKIVKVEMSYDQQKRQLKQKKGEILQKICSLPANALKLDLILQQLSDDTLKARLQGKYHKFINFYLRQASRICQYHHLYFEGIILLAVIPDFNGLELLIDDFVQFLKKNNSYQNKKLLNNIQNQLVDKLLTLCRECVRDNLVKKLINLRSLSAQTVSKPANLRKSELQDIKDYLSNSESIKRYKERLQKKDINFFYNLKDSDFQRMLQEKDEIIKKCQQFETQQVTRKRFQDKQALRYVLDAIPLPKS